jgi:hypothetical protein
MGRKLITTGVICPFVRGEMAHVIVQITPISFRDLHSYCQILAQDLGYVFGHFSLAEKPPLKEFGPLALLGATLYTEKQSADFARLIESERSGRCNQPISIRSRRPSEIRPSSEVRGCRAPSGQLWRSGGERGNSWHLSAAGVAGTRWKVCRLSTQAASSSHEGADPMKERLRDLLSEVGESSITCGAMSETSAAI